MMNNDPWVPLKIRESTKKKLDEFDDSEDETYDGKISFILDKFRAIKESAFGSLFDLV